jgi:thermitase
MRLRSLAIATVAAVFFSPAAARAALPPLGIGIIGFGGEYVPGELLVKFKDAVSADQRHAAIASLGHDRLATIDPGWIHVRTAPDETVETALAAYALDPTVEWAQPNYLYRASAFPNDPRYAQIWGLHNTGQLITTAATQPGGSPLAYTINNPGTPGADMNLEKAWNSITDCSSVVVAVVDTGVNYLHRDLAANMWDGGLANPNHGKNFVNGPPDDATLDLNGHGTHVAGTIGAIGNNAIGTVGVCWQATIMAVRVLDASGSGSTASIAAGVNFAVSNGAKVINMSLGGAGFDQVFSDTITNAQASDVLVVVAAGNANSNNDLTPTYPCNFTQPNLLCVAALDQGYQRASFSNWGATSVDVGAPGTNVVSTWPGPALGDPLDGTTSASWTRSAQWAFATSGSGLHLLVDPPNALSGGPYGNNANDKAWRTFDTTGANRLALHFLVSLGILTNDHVRVAWASTAADPFVGGTVVADETAQSFFGSLAPAGFDISGCVGATCAIGFQLTSDASGAGQGAAVAFLTVDRIDSNADAYNTENGTSMATPMTAGVATMLRAYNPQFTYADTVAAIKGGGRPVAALATTTTSGRAVDAMGSLAFIRPPTGLAAVIQ